MPVLTRARQLQPFLPIKHQTSYGHCTQLLISQSVWMLGGHTVCTIDVGGRHFLLFGLLRAVKYVLWAYPIYYVHTLCIYTTIYIFSGPPAMTKGRPPTTMICTYQGVWGNVLGGWSEPALAQCHKDGGEKCEGADNEPKHLAMTAWAAIYVWKRWGDWGGWTS